MKPEQVKPATNRLLIKEVDEIEQYEGLIDTSAAQAAKEPSNVAEIIRIPANLEEEYNNMVQVGDKVIFNRHAGAIIPMNTFDKNAPVYRLIKPNDILAII